MYDLSFPHKVILFTNRNALIYPERFNTISQCRDWCNDQIGVNGLLWKHDIQDDWGCFYFAHSGDALAFKLRYGQQDEILR